MKKTIKKYAEGGVLTGPGDEFTPAERKIVDQYTKLGFTVTKVNGQLQYKKDPNFKAPSQPAAQPTQKAEQPMMMKSAASKPSSRPADAIPLPDYNNSDSRKAYAASFREKYGKDLLKGYGDIPLRVNDKPVYGSRTSKQAAIEEASALGLNPALFYASSMIEGQSGIYSGSRKLPDGKPGWTGYTGDKDYPISALWGFGLDSFQDYYPSLKKKGYLPQDFDSQFKVWDQEGGPEGSTGGSENVMFKNTDAGIKAKAAMMRAFYDESDAYAKKRGYNLTPEQRDYFALAHFNSGAHGYEMMDSYNKAGLLKSNDFITSGQMPNVNVNFMYKGKPMSAEASKKLHQQIYGNVAPRLAAARGLQEEGLFEYGGKMPKAPKGVPKYANGTPDPIPGIQQFQPSGSQAVNNWQQENNLAPINPNAPTDQQLFRLDNSQQPQNQKNIIPLSQFYDAVDGANGQTLLNPSGRYVDDQGNTTTTAEQQAKADEISAQNKMKAMNIDKQGDAAEFIATTGMAAINAYFAKQQAGKLDRTNRRRAIMQEISTPVNNPYAEGTGSQALMKYGGRMKYPDGGEVPPGQMLGDFTAPLPLFGTGRPKAPYASAEAEANSKKQMAEAQKAANRIKLKDTRTINPATGQPYPKGKAGTKSISVDPNVISVITQHAKAQGINPYDALAIAYQESNFGASGTGFGEVKDYYADQDVSDSFNEIDDRFLNEQANMLTKALKDKFKYADRLGYSKRGDDYKFQAYNGYGKIIPRNGEKAYYGIPISKDNPLDMSKNPAYGKTVLSLRDLLQNNPEIQKIVDSSKAFVPYANFKEYGGEIESYENGGEMQASGDLNVLGGGKTKVISTSDHSNPMFEFSGKTHDEGGIGVQYGGNIAEVENKEVGWVDKEGGLNIFGKLKLPGTNQTFRKTALDMAEQEKKVDGMKSKYLNILTNSKDTNPYQESAKSTAKVMFKSLDKQSKQIAEKKEALASYQNLILSMAEQGMAQKMAYGGKMPSMPEFAVGGSLEGPDDPNDVKAVQAFIDKNSDGKSPLKAEDFIEISKKYGIPLDLMLAQARQESHFGTKGRAVRTKNMFNVGNTDDGTANTQDSWKAGLERYAKLLSTEYSKDGKVNTQDLLNRGFTRTKDGKRYASDPKYVQKLSNILDEINPGNTYSYVTTSGSNSSSQPAAVSSTQNYSAYDPNVSPVSPISGVPINNPNTGTTTIQTPYGAADKAATPFNDKVNIGNGNRQRGAVSPLAIEQIAPELLALATNRREPVYQQTYQPDLLQTFDVSYQLGRNQNQSTFNQLTNLVEMSGNTEALGQLAAQKYQADQAYNMQEVQGNATQRAQVYNQNTATLNDAKVKNLALIADQQAKQTQAKANTRAEDIAAFKSISAKVLQNQLENKTYNAYANLFEHYGFDKNGNVTFSPDKITRRFTSGEAQQFGMMAAQQGASAIMNGDFSRQFTKVKNQDGSTTTTETLGTNKKIQEEYKALKNQGFDDALIGNMLRAKYPETITQD